MNNMYEFVISNALLSGSGFKDGKNRILDFFLSNSKISDRVSFLKKEYGLGGWSLLINNINVGFLNHSNSGIVIHHRKDDYDIVMSWNDITKRIDKLINNGLYSLSFISDIELNVENTYDQLCLF